MAKRKQPVTPAIRQLRQNNIPFEGHLYDYVEGGGTGRFSEETGADEHQVIKTLVMQDDENKPLIVLMFGDKQVSTKELARQIGARSVQPCEPKIAERHSGYQIGGTSPFGTRHDMPVYYEAAIEKLPIIYINGGKRGYIISMSSADMLRVLKPRPVEVARD